MLLSAGHKSHVVGMARREIGGVRAGPIGEGMRSSCRVRGINRRPRPGPSTYAVQAMQF